MTCQGTNDDDTLNGTDGEDTISGGPGNDDMYGKVGNDTLNGDDGEDKIDAQEPLERNGEDTVSGGPGNDIIAANDGVKGDAIDCGPGSRDIVYSDKGDNVSSDCEWHRSYDTPGYCSVEGGLPWTPGTTGKAAQGQPGSPPPAGGILWCIDGTPRNDKKLNGTAQSDLLDLIWADKGDDKIDGRLGQDSIEGWSGNDILKGGAGNDFLYGESSDNPYDEGFFKGAGEDKISGGPGDDFISAIDNKKDTISCGGGNDVVQRDESGVEVRGPGSERSTVTDKIVNVNDCEYIFRRGEQTLWWCRRYGHRHRG